MAVKAFISHATEDKERFVVGFATRLRGRGIDTWVDQWEISPGDSLVQKIFTEGLDKSDVVIAVLSKFSIHKRWVREELDASVVNRIQRDAKIIPVVLDSLTDQEIPQALRAILHVKVPDLKDHDAAFDQIVGAIYGHSDRPLLGNPPAYTRVESAALPGLTQIDSIILKLVGDLALEEDSTVLHPHIVLERAEGFGISVEVATDSLFVLDRRDYLGAETAMQGDIILLYTSVFGLQEYARAYVPDYSDLVTAVSLRLVNHGEEVSEVIAESLARPHMLVRHVLDALEHEGLVELVHFAD